VVGIYVNGNMEEKLERLEEWMEDKEERERSIIGGDFNARTGNKGGRINKEEDEEEIGRMSKDGKINREKKN